MELTGEEKRIQALFSQLRIEDEFVAPRFTVPVIRVNSVTRRRRLNFSFAAILLSAIAAVAWWGSARLYQPISSSGSIVPSPAPVVVRQSGAGEIASVALSPVSTRRRTAVSPTQSAGQRLLARRFAAVAAAHQQVMENAKAISNWESPTSSLLESASSEVLTTLPQLNENASQLKSFLPDVFN